MYTINLIYSCFIINFVFFPPTQLITLVPTNISIPSPFDVCKLLIYTFTQLKQPWSFYSAANLCSDYRCTVVIPLKKINFQKKHWLSHTASSFMHHCHGFNPTNNQRLKSSTHFHVTMAMVDIAVCCHGSHITAVSTSSVRHYLTYLTP